MVLSKSDGVSRMGHKSNMPCLTYQRKARGGGGGSRVMSKIGGMQALGQHLTGQRASKEGPS